MSNDKKKLNRLGQDEYVDLVEYLSTRKKELLDKPPCFKVLAKEASESMGLEIPMTALSKACKRLGIIPKKGLTRASDKELDDLRQEFRLLMARIETVEKRLDNFSQGGSLAL